MNRPPYSQTVPNADMLPTVPPFRYIDRQLRSLVVLVAALLVFPVGPVATWCFYSALGYHLTFSQVTVQSWTVLACLPIPLAVAISYTYRAFRDHRTQH